MEKKIRPSKDIVFMKIAQVVSVESTCDRRNVGAVIVKDGQVLATGYNGAPKGLQHCIDNPDGCLRKKMHVPSGKQHELCRAVHAETNAIIQCAIHGCSPMGATIYVTTSPCSMCLKSLINAGIQRIVVLEDYPDNLSKKLLKETNIQYDILDMENDSIASKDF